MRTPEVLTLPAFADRDNEDAVALGPGIAVVVDGAGLPKRLRGGCRHSVAWFSRSIADAFCAALATDRSMSDALTAAIQQVADSHRRECDLTAGSPSATVAAWRLDGDEIEYLVLCDASIVLNHRGGGVEEITDGRLDSAITDYIASRIGRTPTREDRYEHSFEALESTRNAPNGFWCVHVDPAAAQHALTGRAHTEDLASIVAASDGGTRGYQLLDSHTLVEFGSRTTNLQGVADEIRAAETAQAKALAANGTKVHDDLTLVALRFD